MFLDAQRSARITSPPVTPAPSTEPAPRPGTRRRRPPPTRILCLGEALVNLISERQIESVSAVRSFVPHFGGAVANVAVVAADGGAQVALAGGAGDDDWGEWLQARLVRHGIDLSRFRLMPGAHTLFALVVIAPGGEPRYEIHGDAVESVVHALGQRVDEAVRSSAALLISSNTLVGEREREITMRARELALELTRPVIFDANLRLHRWRSRADAAASSNACVPGALLVRATAAEAFVMTGEDEPEAAAAALLKAGARMVVLTLGPHGAMMRGELRADVRGVRARVLSTVGAGDVLTGVLLSRLAASRFYPPSVAAALPGRWSRRPGPANDGARLTSGARGASARGRAGTARGSWRPPSSRRVRAIRDWLRRVYGIPLAKPHGHPIAELILTVLSQSTNDRNRDVAYLALRQRFPGWEAVRDAPVDEIEEAIRPGGISKVKSIRIKAILEAISDTSPTGDLSLDWLPDRSVEEAQRYLTGLPGVGRKTAACVLLFALGMRDVPVDTHVSRVSTRLGLLRAGAPFDEQHDEMLAFTPPGQELEFHLNLLRHGRRTCHARRPNCQECVLNRLCPSAFLFTPRGGSEPGRSGPPRRAARRPAGARSPG